MNAAAYTSLGQIGIRFDLVLNNTAINLASSGTALAAQLALIRGIAPFVSSVEGPNEIDGVPVTYQGLSGAQAAITLQQDLYAAVHADPALQGIAVLPFSLAQNTLSATYGDLSAYADYGNIHAYGSYGVPPTWWLSHVLKTTDAPARPTIITETGNYTLNDRGSGVSQGVQAKWLVDTLLDAFRAGVAQTYLYQLMDPVADPAGTNYELHWGLFNPDGTPKLAATAIHNLMAILDDPGAAAATFAPGGLDYTITGLPADIGFTSLMQKSDGRFDVQLWQEPLLWNEATLTEYAVAPATVTLRFANVMYQVQVFDPLVGTTPIATYAYVNSLTLSLGTDALIVEVTPQGTATAPAVVPATPVVLGISYGTDTGASATDGVTASATPTLHGTAMAGVQLTIRDGAAVLGTPVASSAGIWALSLTAPLAQGAHAITATASTAAGTSPASAPYALVIDSVAAQPTALAASLPAGTVLRPGQAVSFTLALSEPVLLNTAAGKPTLLLNTGGTATLDPAQSTATALVFRATITAGQAAANLQATALSLNGATATDPAGNALAATTLAATPGSSFGIVVDPTPLPVSLGTGPDQITVRLSEAGWNGDAQFTLSVDGTQVGGTQTAAALHAAGQTQAYTLNGSFGQGSHKVAVTLLNGAPDGNYARRLYVDGIAGTSSTATPGGVLQFNTTLTYDSPILWRPTSPVSLGTGPDQIVVRLSENAWKGDAQFTLSVDGKAYGTQTATAERLAGQSQAYTISGTFGPGTHVVTIAETNYAYGGSPLLERSLTLDSITAGGATTTLNSTLVGFAPKTSYVTIAPAATVAPVSLGTGPDSIRLGISEDAFMGDAQFTLSVDGAQVGGTQTASALHGAGQSQAYTLNGSFGQGSHKVAVTLLNGAMDGTYARRLYVDSVAGTSSTATPGGSLLAANTTLTYDSPILWRPTTPVSLGTGPDQIVVRLSENAWKGDAQFTLSVDGKQVGGTQTATAERLAGQSQAYTINGTFGPGTHVVTIAETNYAYGGSPLLERSLTLDSITAAGTTTTLNSTLVGFIPKSTYLTMPARAVISPVTLGTGPDSIRLGISEDAFMGDAQFTLSVDGIQVGGTQTATALHAAGQSQAYTLNGSFGGGAHVVSVNYLNEVSDGSAAGNRNLYVDTITAGVTTTAVNSLQASFGQKNYTTLLPTTALAGVSVGTGAKSITLNISEDAYMGDAQFLLFVDGMQYGGVQTASAQHGPGESQAFTVSGNFAVGTHSVGVFYLNDLNGGTAPLDRNLYIDGVTAGGTTVALGTKLAATGMTTVSATLPAAPVTPGTINAGTSPTLAFIQASGAVALDAGTAATPATLAGSSSRTAFVLHAGAADGDTIANFKAGTTAGDFLELAGYGTGATLARVDASTWVASPASGAFHDTIHLSNSASLVPANYLFI